MSNAESPGTAARPEVSPEPVYLDWNATTPPLEAVLSAMLDVARRSWGNPASVHSAGREARAVLETAREALAGELQVHPRDVLFTSGGTEANNLALHDAPALVTSRLEHPSVTGVAGVLEERGRPVAWLPVASSGRIEPEAVGAALSDLPAGARVALMAVNHETGVLQPIEAVAEITRAAGAWLHVDAVQALGKVPREHYAHADSLSIAGHKLQGPKGIGVLAWRRPPGPRPLARGGAQERGLRPGTQDAALAEGLRVAVTKLPERIASQGRIAAQRDRLEAFLATVGQVNGDTAHRLGHVSNVSIRDWRGDELVAALDLQGIRCSSGSACSAGTSEASPVIRAMHDEARAVSAVRFSLGPDISPQQVDRVISVLSRTLGVQTSRP